jgi:hypothetical protein
MTAEALAEVQESLPDPGQQPDLGVSRRVFLTLPTIPLACIRHLIKPCPLIQVRLSLIYR